MEKCITQKNVGILFKILLVDDEDEEGEEFDDDDEEEEDFIDSDENEDAEDEKLNDREGPSKKRKLD